MNKKKYIDLDKAVDIGYLGDWYQSSIDTTVPPVWTDEHLEELCNDFIIIPKDTESADVEEVRHGKWINHSGGEWGCSSCANIVFTEGSWETPYDNYCPYCGAKMDKEQE